MKPQRFGFALAALAFSSAGFAAEVGYWSFDEGQGTVVADGSGTGNAGTLVNGANAWLPGVRGSALYFDGTLGPTCTRVEILDNPSLRLSRSGSFAAWVYTEEAYRDAPVFAKEGPDGKLSYWFGQFFSGDGHWGTLLDQDGWQGWDFNGRQQGHIPVRRWTHLAVTWDGASVNYYRNGYLTNTLNWGGTIHSSDARLFIGSNAEYTFLGNRTSFHGAIDEVHLYDTAIPLGEVQALATAKLIGVSLLEGEEGTGDLGSLWSSDDLYYTAFNDPATLTSRVQFEGTTPYLAPSELKFALEYNVARGGLAYNIAFYRYSSATLVSMAGGVGSTVDESIAVTLGASAPEFVGAGGELLAVVRWNPINDEAPAYDGWLHRVDQAGWTYKN